MKSKVVGIYSWQPLEWNEAETRLDSLHSSAPNVWIVTADLASAYNGSVHAFADAILQHKVHVSETFTDESGLHECLYKHGCTANGPLRLRSFNSLAAYSSNLNK